MAIDINLVTVINLNQQIESNILYPNPNEGNIELELKSTIYQAELDLILWDLTSKQIDTPIHYFNGYASEKYEFKGLASGSYFLQIKSKDGQIFLKVEVLK